MRGLVYAGMDVARLNFSHGAYAQHERGLPWVRRPPTSRAAASACWSTCRARRSGSAPSPRGPVVWATGETVTITTDDVEGAHDRVSTTYNGLAGDVVGR